MARGEHGGDTRRAAEHRRAGRARAGHCTAAAAAGGDREGSARRPEEPGALADLLRRLHRAAAQPAHADHARQRVAPLVAVDVPGRGHAGGARFRGDAADDGRRPLHHRQQQLCLGDRCADRPPDLALSPAAAAGTDVWRRQPVQPGVRGARRQGVHGHPRRARAGAQPRHRQDRVGHRGRRLQGGPRRHRRAARDQGQGGGGQLGRRHPDARLRRRLRCPDRQARVALLHDPRRGRAGQRDVGEERGAAARRRRHVGDRQLRPGVESDLLGRRQSVAQLFRRRSPGRQSLHRLDRRDRRRHREAAGGITSSPRTTCTTGTPITSRCLAR